VSSVTNVNEVETSPANGALCDMKWLPSVVGAPVAGLMGMSWNPESDPALTLNPGPVNRYDWISARVIFPAPSADSFTASDPVIASPSSSRQP